MNVKHGVKEDIAVETEKMNKTDKPLPPDLLRKMNAYWRAANYLSVRQIYLYDNPLLKRPQMLTDHFAESELAILAKSRRQCW